MTTNDSERAKREPPQTYTSRIASRRGSSTVDSELAFERKLARLARAGYVTGIFAVVVSLTSGVLSHLGITYNTKLVVIAGLIVLTIAAGISYFILRPISAREVDQQNNEDSDGWRAQKGATEIQPAQRLGQGCLFLVLWTVIQGACWSGITALSWPTRFVPNEIFGGGNKIVIPDVITIAFCVQLFIGLAVPNRYRFFALLQLFVAAFIMSWPSFYSESEFWVRFHVPTYLWAAYWIQFVLLAAALWRLPFKFDTTVGGSGDDR